MTDPTKRAPSIATYGYDAAGNPVASVNGVPTDPTKPDDTRELYVVEFRRPGDALWRTGLSGISLSRDATVACLGLDDGAEERITRYIPDDQSAVLRGKLETLEDLFRRASARAAADRRNATIREDWLYAWDDLRTQLAAVERDGKGGGR